MKPLKITTVPEALNSADFPSAIGETEIFAVVVDTFASAICEAMVRFQINSYKSFDLVDIVMGKSLGCKKVSPAGRIASWAS